MKATTPNRAMGQRVAGRRWRLLSDFATATVDPLQAGFWTAEWLEGEREIDEEIARGTTATVYASTEDFLAHLDSVPPADEP